MNRVKLTDAELEMLITSLDGIGWEADERLRKHAERLREKLVMARYGELPGKLPRPGLPPLGSDFWKERQ